MSDKVKDELAQWIDTSVIAEAIASELEEQGIEITSENGKRVWLSFLEAELSEGLRSTVRALF